MPAAVDLATFRDSFWSRTKLVVTQRDACLEWQGSRDSYGYGHVRFNGKLQTASRVAWELLHGSPAPKSVCHRCDNPACVRPEHLWLGTHRENIDDMVAKGRLPARPVKLTPAKAREIRRRLLAGEKQGSLAKELGIAVATVRCVADERTWRKA